MRKITAFIFILALLAASASFADNIRGEVLENLVIGDNYTAESFKLGIEDVFAFSFDRDAEFISGIEIEVRVPANLRSYSSSFAVNIYKQISPGITTGMGTYYGNKYHTLLMPEAARFYIRIPYEHKLTAETAPYTTVVSEPIDFSDSPLMVTVLPMMKGFPSSLYNNNFELKITPLLKDSGSLDISVNIAEGLDPENLTITLDGKAVSKPFTGIRLASGSHNLSAEIPGGTGFTRSFTIRRGETTDIRMDIEKLESFAYIEAPEGTSVFLDGERLEPTADGGIKLDPGEHTVLLKLSDYKISKKFDIKPGKDYKISLFLDIFIEEN